MNNPKLMRPHVNTHRNGDIHATTEWLLLKVDNRAQTIWMVCVWATPQGTRILHEIDGLHTFFNKGRVTNTHTHTHSSPWMSPTSCVQLRHFSWRERAPWFWNVKIKCCDSGGRKHQRIFERERKERKTGRPAKAHVYLIEKGNAGRWKRKMRKREKRWWRVTVNWQGRFWKHALGEREGEK